jgi:hypothetical protein
LRIHSDKPTESMGSRTPGPGWKLSSRLLWYWISLFYLRWRRRRNYYSCQKM